MATEMGFDFVTGNNSEKNINYFTEKLRRTRLRDIRPKLRKKFCTYPTKRDLEFFTIDFLDPKIRRNYLAVPHK
jgi:hypothetical protein